MYGICEGALQTGGKMLAQFVLATNKDVRF